ncbi:MAG TPA: ATP synthase F1 subunit gamma [Gemmatimonadota bacterium]|jgi:F-type H+-transporting ATPase subunit gamma|nr:ATP synthase F1 subunit gamma [Gemmatimonadota bacterium]
MAKAREIKRRIRSIDNTRQITKTMEMVAASKLKRAQDRVVAARPFDEFMRQVIMHVREGAAEELVDFPLLRSSAITNRVGVLVVTSNRGLAGAFNANLVKAARAHMKALRAEGKEIELHVIGKKGASMLRYLGDTPERTIVDLPDRPSYEDAGAVAEPLIEAFLTEKLDAVYLVYSLFKSPVEQRPVVAQLLPLPERGEIEEGFGAGASLREADARRREEAGEEHGYEPIYEFLPSPAAILSQLLPLFLRYGIYRAVAESAASEHGARRTAMKNATDNAKELIRSLTRSYNRARQAQITQEIAELVGGAEALKG